jgi:hypothetical protein
MEGIPIPAELNNIPVKYVTTVGGRTYGQLSNLYINFEFIAGLLVSNGGPDQELPLIKFLQDLCNGINSALGGFNKLEPVIKDDNIVTIIDQTLSFSGAQNFINLEVYGYNPKNQTSNFVKDIKFVSKITPQLASTISIGATAAGSSVSEIDGTAFSKWSEGLVDRFSKEILEPSGLSTLGNITTVNEATYQEEFNKFPPLNNFISRTFQRIFQTGRWGRAKARGDYDKDIRKVNDPYYKEIYGNFMDFDKFYILASEIRKKREEAGFYKEDDRA